MSPGTPRGAPLGDVTVGNAPRDVGKMHETMGRIPSPALTTAEFKPAPRERGLLTPKAKTPVLNPSCSS